MPSPLESFSERQYLTSHLPVLEVPRAFLHTEPAPPARPAYPSTLTGPEQAQVDQWREDRNDASVTLPAAQAKRDEFKIYNAAVKAWNFANHTARRVQYRIAYADGLILNKPTGSGSADETGSGSAPPPRTVPRQDP